jgi:adenylate cyclase class 2
MLEVEVKYRAADPAAVEAKLAAMGGKLTEERTDADLYLAAPDRDFKRTDEAFRLRRIGPKNYITYKGPKREAATKTRTEIEVPLADGDGVAADAERLFMSLGYRPVTTVRKRRRVYHLTRDGFDLEVCFDDVDRVGPFVELEILVDEARFEAAKEVLLQTAADLGLTEKEPRSYLGMTLEAIGRE